MGKVRREIFIKISYMDQVLGKYEAKRYEILQLVSQFSCTYHGDFQSSLEEFNPKKYSQCK